MPQSVIKEFENRYKKSAVVSVRSGDTVRVHQKIKEGNKERIQIFQGLVIRTDRINSHTSRILVRRVSSGVGVEKSFLLHSPTVIKVEVVKRSKVRRNYLSYMRGLTGKATRLSSVDFDRDAVNTVKDEKAEVEEEKIQGQTAEEHKKKDSEEKTDKENSGAEKSDTDSAENSEKSEKKESD